MPIMSLCATLPFLIFHSLTPARFEYLAQNQDSCAFIPCFAASSSGPKNYPISNTTTNRFGWLVSVSWASISAVGNLVSCLCSITTQSVW
ncbi:hypothetical protein B0T10DRAFT_48547 [Thelonectria olida]|uniref:Secreted protein n=1 Tax=Thelonectria olida TaxID=1576542 RepID=A0A9P8W391_9HYPO|nr:hypothetical protein B0T10DRAFT_48547 [Thelonectria olida]